MTCQFCKTNAITDTEDDACEVCRSAVAELHSDHIAHILEMVEGVA